MRCRWSCRRKETLLSVGKKNNPQGTQGCTGEPAASSEFPEVWSAFCCLTLCYNQSHMPTGRSGSIHLFKFKGIDVFLHWSWFLVAFYEIQRGGIGRYSSVS